MASTGTERPSRGKRVRGVIEGVLFVIGIPTAIVTFVTFIPSAWQATHYRQTEYALLRTIHAGDSDDYLRSRLGEPTQSHALGAGTQLREQVYVREEYMVAAVEDDAGQVLTLSVFACVTDFRPTFSTPRRTDVTLNDRVFSSAESVTSQSKVKGDAANRRVVVWPGGGTGSSPDIYSEQTFADGSTHYRTYLLASNPACGAASPSTPDGYDGRDGSDAPAALDRFRETSAPNVYLESIDPDLVIDANGCLVFSDHPVDEDATSLRCAYSAVDTVSLPNDYLTPHPVAWYRNLWTWPGT